MSGYCKYCDSLVDASEMVLITSASKHGDVWMKNYWLGCIVCDIRR